MRTLRLSLAGTVILMLLGVVGGVGAVVVAQPHTEPVHITGTIDPATVALRSSAREDARGRGNVVVGWEDFRKAA